MTKASSVEDLRGVLEELEKATEAEEEELEEETVEVKNREWVATPDSDWNTKWPGREDEPDGILNNKARDPVGWSATSDAEYYTKYAGDQDVVDLEDEYAKAVLDYFRARRRLALVSKKLQEAYDEAGMSIELSEVVVGRA